MFTELLVRPIFNALIYLVEVIPGNSLGLGIIAVTVLIRLILLVPQAKAIRSQAEMQKVQPLLNELKIKYKGDQTKIGEETMKIFKEHNVNPLGGCLPLLIQLPVIYAIYAMLRMGIDTSNTDFLYSFVSYPAVIDYSWFWVADLQAKDTLIFPLLVGGFQFIQMRIMMVRNKKKNSTSLPTEQAAMQSMMTYGMPVFLVFIAMGFSAGLSLYWTTSTVFAILQQEFILRALKGEKEVLVVSDLTEEK